MVITVKFDGKLVVLTALYLSIGFFALLFAYPSLSIWLPSNSSEMASWVQAIGAVVAIAAGFIIARFQLNENRKDELKKQRELEVEEIVAHSFLLIDGYERVSLWASDSELLLKRGNISWDYLIDSCDKVRVAIDLLDPYRTPSLKDVARLTYVKRHMDNLKWNLDEMKWLKSHHQNISLLAILRIIEALGKLVYVVEEYKQHIFEYARRLANEDQLNELEELRVMHAALRDNSPQRVAAGGIGNPDLPSPEIAHA